MARTTVDLLIHSAEQLVTCAGEPGPRRGRAMGELGLIADGAVAIDGETIVAVGPAAELRARYRGRRTLDASGRAVCPGFVDCHTHTVYGGDRVNEFEMRIRGATYMEILAAGGGILSTMAHTRSASPEALVAGARRRLDEMLALGTTTLEIKTGYGLDGESEAKMLDVIARLDGETPQTLVPTFLGAHTVPPEYRGNPAAYVALVSEEMVPAAAAWYAASDFGRKGVPFFIDVFCEEHAFDVEQSRRILQAGQARGLGAKIHVDQFNDLGGSQMAVEIGAISADHLDVTGPAAIEGLAAARTICVPLPAVNFNLGQTTFAPARALIDAGAAVALATDFNPGSAPCVSMPLVMAIACRYQKLTPAEALTAATLNAAHAVGLGDRVGSLAAGKRADLAIVDGGDYRHIAYRLGGNPLAAVVVGGEMRWTDPQRV